MIFLTRITLLNFLLSVESPCWIRGLSVKKYWDELVMSSVVKECELVAFNAY